MANLGFTAKTYDPLAEKLKMLNNAPKVTAGSKLLAPAIDMSQPMPDVAARPDQSAPAMPAGEKMNFWDALALGMGGLGGTSSQNLQKMALAKQQRIADAEKAAQDRSIATEKMNKTLMALKARGVPDSDLAILATNPELLVAYTKEMFKPKTTDDTTGIKEYKFAVGQGYKGSFADYKADMAKAGATTIQMPTEGERKAGALASRLSFAMQQIQDTLGTAGEDVTSPTAFESIAKAVGGEAGQRLASSEDRQIINAAQLDMLDAALTLGTGAAYTKEQLEGYRESYFPQYGDSQATIEAKQKRLMNLIETAKSAAGRAGVNITMPTVTGGGELFFNPQTGKLENK